MSYPTNTRPSYFAQPHYHRCVSGKLKRVKHMFSVYEVRDNVAEFCFKMDNRFDRLNNILKRGIALEDAKILFYQMDEDYNNNSEEA
jgi:uncharacterized DUF497 family protein